MWRDAEEREKRAIEEDVSGEGAATMTRRPWMELESGHVKKPVA